MRRVFLLFFIIFFVLKSYAQIIQPFVVNAAGGSIQNDKVNLEWSLGELAVTTIETPNNLLSQGFLQPLIDRSITGISNELDGGDIVAFPNPVASHLYFKTSKSNIVSIVIHDVLGRKVLQTEFKHDVDLNQLGYGLYFIALFDKKQQLIHNLKIIKI